MSFEFTYRIRQDVLQLGLRDLDCVVLTAAVTSDDGEELPAGAEGTIVSVFNEGEAYVVKFSTPLGAIATAEPHQLRRVEHAGLRRSPSKTSRGWSTARKSAATC